MVTISPINYLFIRNIIILASHFIYNIFERIHRKLIFDTNNENDLNVLVCYG